MIHHHLPKLPGIILAAAAVLLLGGCASAPAGPADRPAARVVSQRDTVDRPSPYDVPEMELGGTGPVFLGFELPEDQVVWELLEDGSDQPEMAKVTLIFENIPEGEEGSRFTLIGGGLDDTGLHGPNATGFEGKGYHFAGPADDPGDTPPRDEGYKTDYTRTVEDGVLIFDIYYVPTNIYSWGPRYPEGTGLALTMMRAETWDRALHADNNQYNWSFGGIRPGDAAVIILDMSGAE
ncbi:hypothetical protein [Spirochaeta africana]|uniref:Uncharacterized protein n=1 Tax=Spirochaeta africana (strain ATCC 700263 / DSM 8902 / Z-7692) TaxID=889378 RepID=H9ULI8_SPIAZ|nr:hypothetical protein [Spirochaeta africana]AFG38381.1 hypothetical protein Spiaf_2349 [Spirochaeta africana DSM 8902]